MSSTINNLNLQELPSASDMRVGIVVCEWNSNITTPLLEATVSTLKQYGAKPEHIMVRTVPGSFELIFAANRMVKSGLVDGVIAIGCIIRGDTPHFDFIAQGCTNGLAQLNANGSIPVVFGVLTTDTLEQAEERAGGRLGNKGEEYAVTAIKMIDYARSYER
ncbi:MAG: 6,7-dimethyl-8-ribityllumazine synthase [Bacteroidaceae bacterium]|nr:6,7-dimethyl-8-ribityllumazine synthase [Bacteroidaceae bacterium]MBR4649688.1 6,7-dimethyl-8-ribityllumazine synthase [Bacteroidaceae bacterium]MDO4951496.1 6,7-dimethyl-8-ribityllumazine synthase [Bacteroidales bacterium]